jgi:hypothetical protein
MSTYTPISDYEVKDGLSHGDPEKIVSGTELQAEFDAIAASLRSKVDSAFSMISALQTEEVAHVLLDLVYKPGMIKPWYGSSLDIPTGWALCDGSNGTPDLRGRFILGAGGAYNLSATGGAESVTSSAEGSHNHGGVTGATVADLPEHNHTIFVATKNGAGGDTQGFGTSGNIAVAGDQQASVGYIDTNQAGTQIIGDTGSGGSGHTHTISDDGSHAHTVATLPPYYGLYYIMYLGFDTEAGIGNSDSPLPLGRPIIIQMACSDLTSALTAGTNRAYVRAPLGFTISDVRASLLTGSSSGAVTIDINKNGSTLLSTKLTIDANETTSTTAATPYVLSGTTVLDDDHLSVDIDGAGTGAAGLIVSILGTAS